ncbi:MAG TPA: HAMP domain-containing sensor histidine kinase [Candidatus Nitrosocosmicus sp.]|nr:HAMP domain-containing sensor histidine kinase [Candidatus Nitrosocosmicus sp.]
MYSQVSANAKNMIHIYGDSRSLSIIIQTESIKKIFLECVKRGIKYKYITEITKDNISYCKEVLKIIRPGELRHLDGVKGNFALTESEYLATPTLYDAQPLQEVVYSNAKQVVEQNECLFEILWDKSITAEQRIKEIEEGLESDVIEIIRNSSRAKKLYLNLVNNAKKEILIIFPTVNAFIRQEKLGVIKSLRKVSTGSNVIIRIMMPIESFGQNGPDSMPYADHHQQKEIIGYDMRNILFPEGMDNIEIRNIDRMSEAKATILIVDRNQSFVMELKDDTKDTFDEAIGLSTYSNSISGVLSYVAIFESLWIETKLYEKLRVHDSMQKEFINIAAHELRTPAQAILGFSLLLKKHPEIKDKLVDGIYKNASRLQKLINNILDVTTIESQSLHLNKEKFDLNYTISNLVGEYRLQIKKASSRIKLIYDDNNHIFVESDKGRIIQVISNLLDNAIKFTKDGGEISISCEVDMKDDFTKHVVVGVRDSGSGINSEIFPRLFTKFASKSYQGTGLGLFISKNIIEEHGGRIWAKNNEDGNKGSTVAFSLPLEINSPSEDQKDTVKNIVGS